MSDNPELVLSAYFDGEPVDAADVLAALETDEGRFALADFVRLRVIASQSDPLPGPEFYARMRDLAPVIRPPRRSIVRTSVIWPLAAAVAASLLLGFWSGSTMASRNVAEPSGPPKAVRVVEFQPGIDWQPIPVKEGSR